MKKVITLFSSLLIFLTMTNFAFAAKKDIIAPTILKTFPASDTTDVMVESTILIRFSEGIQKGNTFSKIYLKEDGSKKIDFNYTLDSNLLRIVPKSGMKYNTDYTITIPASAVKDKNGNSLAAKFEFSFSSEEDISAENEEVVSGMSSYLIEVDTSLSGEFTEDKQTAFTQALKRIGMEASITSINKASTYNVYLEYIGESKIHVIQTVQKLTGLPLAQARDLVNAAPVNVLEDVPRSRGENAVKCLEEVGATVTLNSTAEVEEENTEKDDAVEEDNTSEESTAISYNVILEDTGYNQTGVIAILRSLGVSLSEAHDMTQNTPIVVREDIGEVDALAIKKKLEDAGATASVVENE